MAFSDLSDEERQNLRDFLGLEDDEEMMDDDLEDEAGLKREAGNTYISRNSFPRN